MANPAPTPGNVEGEEAMPRRDRLPNIDPSKCENGDVVVELRLWADATPEKVRDFAYGIKGVIRATVKDVKPDMEPAPLPGAIATSLRDISANMQEILEEFYDWEERNFRRSSTRGDEYKGVERP